MAPLSRRFAAIIIDWLLCQLIAVWVFGYDTGAVGAASFAPLAVFAAENLLLVSTVGYTLGHRILGLRVVRLAPDDPTAPTAWVATAPGIMAGAIRTALLCLAVPAMIWDSSGRGWHDRAAATFIVRRPPTR